MKNECCSNCRFFLIDTGYTAAHDGCGVIGRCRRYPPVKNLEITSSNPFDDVFDFDFVMVFDDLWCGEFQL